jgi:hypothetical protein
MPGTADEPQGEPKLCPVREKPCALNACQWWVPDTGDLEQGGNCAMIYLALKKEPKWKYSGPTAPPR